ncbi:NAD(P)H-binding protein [Silvimonas sp.]|uniref:NAD(P)H-binding protein n=1 Tax=Silvimonas sp. TaxID=2650811 RepID=UPI00283DCC5C|nr:NAD(P)H-binding protein [Silvimonas sp.]MDR3430007.1 NAD(P)H-binding protein [Silvimonas sp.]
MKVILLGATGMVGQGVLRECLRDPAVDSVLCVGRNATGQTHPKLRELVAADLYDLSAFAEQLSGFDACFFCLGVSSAGMAEAPYRRITYDLTLAVAQLLVRQNPALTFIYVSGAGTDSSEHGRAMWARVKGATENALLKLPFQAAYMLRPGAIQPLHGVKSKTGWYRAIYVVVGPLLTTLRRVWPQYITTTEQMGRVMLTLAQRGYPRPVLETVDINQLTVESAPG